MISKRIGNICDSVLEGSIFQLNTLYDHLLEVEKGMETGRENHSTVHQARMAIKEASNRLSKHKESIAVEWQDQEDFRKEEKRRAENNET